MILKIILSVLLRPLLPVFTTANSWAREVIERAAFSARGSCGSSASERD